MTKNDYLFEEERKQNAIRAMEKAAIEYLKDKRTGNSCEECKADTKELDNALFNVDENHPPILNKCKRCVYNPNNT